MDITFCGAARTVTGSSFMLEHEGFSVLIDLGLPQGSDEKKLGLDLPFSPSAVDAVILTHAHIDHSGRLPLLAKLGYTGPIYSTSATMELAGIMLEDSAHIQESEAEWKSRKRLRHGEEAVEPLYETADAEAALELFRPVGYGERVDLTPSLWFEMKDAGHLLGSASVRIHCLLPEGGERTIVFSGDIGNFDQPMIRDPDYFHEADFVVMESTYGDRLHHDDDRSESDALAARARVLAGIIDRTFRRGGNVVIPSFAVGRTQEILYLLRIIMDRKMLDYQIPVFVDSPLSVKATKVFSSCLRADYFDDEARSMIDRGINPILFPSLTTITDAEESKALNARKESAVIISSSGMCEAGRIRHHLKHTLWRSASGHADQKGLEAWINEFSRKPEAVFVVHGEENTAAYFASRLNKLYSLHAYAPCLFSRYDLLHGEIPVQPDTALRKKSAADLRQAFSMLGESRSRLEEVVSRMEKSVSAIDLSDEKKARKLSDAIRRLADDIAFLSEKWGGDAS